MRRTRHSRKVVLLTKAKRNVVRSDKQDTFTVDEQRSKPVTAEPEISVFRSDRPGIRKVLGDLEAEIMEVLWERPINQGTTVREMFEVLYERRHMAYTTVMSTMTRMA